MFDRNAKIYVAGSDLLAEGLKRNLKEHEYLNVLGGDIDLTDQREIEDFFKKNSPEYVFLSSMKTGGILGNVNSPADLIYLNTVSQTNVIHAAYKYGVKKLLFLGSACSYPKFCKQPIREEYLLTAPLEETSEAYAIAKISGIKLCQAFRRQYGMNFISAIPTNSFGPGDDFGEEGHVISSLIRRFHEAKVKNKDSVVIWGTGKPKREFLYINDVAQACIFLMQKYDGEELINIAGGREVSIKQLAELVKKIVKYRGKIAYNTKKPDGMPRRKLAPDKLFKLGWKPKITLEKGLEITYKWYQNYAK